MSDYLDNCDKSQPSDYTEWQRDHLFADETVESLVGQIRAFEKEREVSHA